MYIDILEMDNVNDSDCIYKLAVNINSLFENSFQFLLNSETIAGQRNIPNNATSIHKMKLLRDKLRTSRIV